MFGRIANLFKGFMSLFISGVERRNPEALLNAGEKIDTACDRIERFVGRQRH